MGESAATFHVLLDDPGVLATRLGEVARVVASVLNEPRPDAAQRVRYGAGIVARGLDEPSTDALMERFGEAGLGAFAIESGEVAALPRTRRLAGFSFTESGLAGSYRGSDRREDLGWERVLAVHATVLARERSADELERARQPRPLYDVTTLPEDVCRLSTELDFWEDKERTRRLELSLDVVACEPVSVFRILAEDADYAALAEKADSSLANFVAFVRALVARSPGEVFVPPSTREFAKSAGWKALLVEKPEQRDAFNLWLVHAVRTRRAFRVLETAGAEAGEEPSTGEAAPAAEPSPAVAVESSPEAAPPHEAAREPLAEPPVA